MADQMTTPYAGGFTFRRGEGQHATGHVTVQAERSGVTLHLSAYGEGSLVNSLHRLTPDEAIELSGCLELAAHAAWAHTNEED